jgi:SNF2 family DNA or RNA helicase
MATACELVVSEYPLPFTLRPDQVDTVNELCRLDWTHEGLFLDVGTGKTVVATLITLWKALAGQVDNVVVVMPPILLDQWEEWIQEAFPDLSCVIYYGSKKQRAKIDLDVDIMFTTFGMFKNDFEYLKEVYGASKTMLIVDEAAAVRRISTQLYAAVREFTYDLPNKHMLMLTGTALGRPEHAYAYISLKTPELYRDYTRFTLKHIEYVDQYGNPTKYKNLDQIQENLLKQAVWVKADEVLTLPPVTTAPKIYKLTPQHYKLYNELMEEKLLELDDGRILDGTIPERMRHTAQRCVMSPACYGGETIVPAGFQLIDNMCEELGMLSGSDEKLIIFCNYNESNEGVLKYVTEKLKLNAVLAYGKTGPTKNLKTVGRFLKDPLVQVLVAHPKSVGIGINMQRVCRAILFLEVPTTANEYIQALGRVKREGQTRSVIVWIATAKGTIQVDLRRTVTRSEDMVQVVMPTKDTLRDALFGK